VNLPLCRHCQKNKVNRPRGLCWTCYYTPCVRELYPSESKFGRRGVLDRKTPRPMPEPTEAQPGTPQKVAVLEQRAKLGQNLWHPLDPRITQPIGQRRFGALSGQCEMKLRRATRGPDKRSGNQDDIGESYSGDDDSGDAEAHWD